MPVAGGDARRLPLAGRRARRASRRTGSRSNHRSWGVVAAALDGAGRRLVAPDLRGRGRSNGLPGPYAIAQHADDVAAVLDHLGARRARSWPATRWAASSRPTLATRHPGAGARARARRRRRRRSHVPPGVDVDDALAATLGPAMQRLDMTFADRGAYRAFWQQHPSFAGIWSGEVDAQIQHDLDRRASPRCAPRASRRRCGSTAASCSPTRTCATAVREVACPMTMLWAPRGMVDEPARPVHGGPPRRPRARAASPTPTTTRSCSASPAPARRRRDQAARSDLVDRREAGLEAAPRGAQVEPPDAHALRARRAASPRRGARRAGAPSGAASPRSRARGPRRGRSRARPSRTRSTIRERCSGAASGNTKRSENGPASGSPWRRRAMPWLSSTPPGSSASTTCARVRVDVDRADVLDHADRGDAVEALAAELAVVLHADVDPVGDAGLAGPLARAPRLRLGQRDAR